MATKSMEKYLERKFVRWCNDHGAKAIKGPAYQEVGIPDRIVVLPNGGGTLWVEFKGGTSYQLTPMQLHWKNMLQDSDPHRYFKINTKEELIELCNYCLSLMNSIDNLTESK